MSVVVVAPSTPLVTAPEAKTAARVLAADSDDTVNALLKVAQAALEAPSWVGSSLGKQTLEARWPAFPCFRAPRMPYGPVRSIESVKYLDENGDEQTLDPDVYWLIGTETTQASFGLRLHRSWPEVLCHPEAVRVRYEAGHEPADPRLAPVKHAIVLSAVQLRSLTAADLALRTIDVPGVVSRTYTVSDAAERLVKNAVESLLSGFRVYAV